MIGTGTTNSAGSGFAGGLSKSQFLGITVLFWVYVALSNILYAYSMRTGMSRMTNVPLFAPWDARLLQHLVLLPVLVVSFWASLKVQWRPLLVALPLQLILGRRIRGGRLPGHDYCRNDSRRARIGMTPP